MRAARLDVLPIGNSSTGGRLDVDLTADVLTAEVDLIAGLALTAVDFFVVDFAAVDFAAVDLVAVDLVAVDLAAVDFIAVDFFAVDSAGCAISVASSSGSCSAACLPALRVDPADAVTTARPDGDVAASVRLRPNASFTSACSGVVSSGSGSAARCAPTRTGGRPAISAASARERSTERPAEEAPGSAGLFVAFAIAIASVPRLAACHRTFAFPSGRSETVTLSDR